MLRKLVDPVAAMESLIRNISAELSCLILSRGHRRSFYAGAEVFAAGDDASFLPVVISGSVRMIHFLEAGKEVTIRVFQAGEMFAVPPVFDGKAYPSTAVAVERTELLLLPRKEFLAILSESSEFAFAVISWMTEMLRDKTATIETLATASPEHRIAKTLLKLAEAAGADLPVRITLRREDIARLAGITTETTIRVIRRLAERGVVEIDRGKIMIHDLTELRRLLGS